VRFGVAKEGAGQAATGLISGSGEEGASAEQPAPKGALASAQEVAGTTNDALIAGAETAMDITVVLKGRAGASIAAPKRGRPGAAAGEAGREPQASCR